LELNQIYQSLGQLPEYQSKINNKWELYNQIKDPKKIFHYDITSTYLESIKMRWQSLDTIEIRKKENYRKH